MSRNGSFDYRRGCRLVFLRRPADFLALFSIEYKNGFRNPVHWVKGFLLQLEIKG